jgi:hypothetical protein
MKEVQTLLARQNTNSVSLVVLVVGVKEAQVRKDPLLRLLLENAVGSLEIQEAVDAPSVTETLAKCLPLTPQQITALSHGLQNFENELALVGKMMARKIANDAIQINQVFDDTGHFGQVKLGYIKSTSQAVVVKVFRKDNDVSDEPEEDVMKEIYNLVRVDGHPRFVTLLHVCRDKRTDPWSLVFAKAEFGNLETLYKRKSSTRQALLAPACLLVVARDLAAGVVELHRHAIIHRDLGARNALLDRCTVHDKGAGACVRLCDFGLARRVQRKKVYNNRGHCDLPILQVELPHCWLQGGIGRFCTATLLVTSRNRPLLLRFFPCIWMHCHTSWFELRMGRFLF